MPDSQTTRGADVSATSPKLSDGALKAAQHALLVDLKGLLEYSSDQIGELIDTGLDSYPVVADARSPFQWIAEAVEALDALGWRDIIRQHESEEDKA